MFAMQWLKYVRSYCHCTPTEQRTHQNQTENESWRSASSLRLVKLPDVQTQHSRWRTLPAYRGRSASEPHLIPFGHSPAYYGRPSTFPFARFPFASATSFLLKIPQFPPPRFIRAPQATEMAAKCAAAAADLATGRPRKRARFGWDVAPAAEVNAPLFPTPPMCCLGYVLPRYGVSGR
jgi:hypothetical protein